MEIKVKKISQDAKIPKIALAGDAGIDLFSAEEINLGSGKRVFCHTGIAMKIPSGYAGLVWDKSGVAKNFGVKVLGGVFDSNYTGEWLIGLVNLGQKSCKIIKGQKIAQVLIQKVESPLIKEVKNLPQTNRGQKGFGSTGKQ
jgi:dUTP pyrophosphatase